MTKKLVGYVAVDSGQVLIADPCYLKEWKDGDFIPENDEQDNHYGKACKITCSKEGFGEMTISGIAGNGVVSETYSGDGCYPVYAVIGTNGRPKRLIIEFN